MTSREAFRGLPDFHRVGPLNDLIKSIDLSGNMSGPQWHYRLIDRCLKNNGRAIFAASEAHEVRLWFYDRLTGLSLRLASH